MLISLIRLINYLKVKFMTELLQNFSGAIVRAIIHHNKAINSLSCMETDIGFNNVGFIADQKGHSQTQWPAMGETVVPVSRPGG